jgi:ferrous iron transport protein A
VVHHEKLLPLELVLPGEWADVAEVTGTPVWVTRMAEMGVHSGSRLRVLRQGTPCLLEVGNARLSVRSDPASLILVRPVVRA